MQCSCYSDFGFQCGKSIETTANACLVCLAWCWGTTGLLLLGAVFLAHLARARRAHPPARAARALRATLLRIAGARGLGSRARRTHWSASSWRIGTPLMGVHWAALRASHRAGRGLSVRVGTIRALRAISGRTTRTSHSRVRRITRPVRVDRRATGTSLRRPRLHGARRQASARDDTLLRAVKADAKSLTIRVSDLSGN